jgi:hypothetical protein
VRRGENAAVAPAEMMARPELWPLRWILPLVHRERRDDDWGLPSQAFLLAGRGTTVFLGNVYYLEGGPLRAKLSALERRTYVSFDAIVADGWRVD